MDFSGSATLSAASTECDAVGDDAYINRRFTSAQDTYTRTGTAAVVGLAARRCRWCCTPAMTRSQRRSKRSPLRCRPPRGGAPPPPMSAPTGVGAIIDNDNPEAYLAGPVTVTEGATLDFEVRLVQAAPEGVTVTVSTATDPAATHPRERDRGGARLSAEVEQSGGHPGRVDVSNGERVHDPLTQQTSTTRRCCCASTTSTALLAA